MYQGLIFGTCTPGSWLGLLLSSLLLFITFIKVSAFKLKVHSRCTFVWSAPKMRFISQNAALSSSSPSGPWVIGLISHQACDRFSSHCSVSHYCAKFSAFCFKMRVWLLVTASCVEGLGGFVLVVLFWVDFEMFNHHQGGSWKMKTIFSNFTAMITNKSKRPVWRLGDKGLSLWGLNGKPVERHNGHNLGKI